MKNKKDKKDHSFINSEMDESLLNELKDLESIASEINSKIEQELLDEIKEQDEILKELQPELEEAQLQQEIIDEIKSEQDEILKELQPELEEAQLQQEIIDEIKSEQDEILKELQPELDELKEKEKILDEIIEKESALLEELRKHESEINELIVGYSETMKDIVNPQEELKEFNELIDKSDKNFYSFAESIRIENEISKEDLEVAPDVLKESVLGKTVIKNGINEKKFSFSNLLDSILPNFLNSGASGNTSYFTVNRIVAGISLSLLVITLFTLNNNPIVSTMSPPLWRSQVTSSLSIEASNNKITIENKEDNNIEFLLMTPDGKVVDQRILKDSLNFIEKINGMDSYRLIINDVATELTLIDTVINF